jgi:hypothetical protein
MYYPYFRGKQYELITLRDNVSMFGKKIIPIIEPVKRSLSGLTKTLEVFKEKNAPFILIANPACGDLESNPSPLHTDVINVVLNGHRNWSLGCIVKANTTEEDIRSLVNLHNHVTIVHDGCPNGKKLSDFLKQFPNISGHIFIEKECGKLYQNHFPRTDGQYRVLVRDGFKKRTNREHPEGEHFSDLHITYTDENMTGFGDFLIVGDEYSESGGPAYAVAIHLAYIDEEKDNDMYLRHYVSDSNSTPKDPAGKFEEALEKLANDVESPKSKIFQSGAVREFLEMNKSKYYPGLGYVKKLSMQHHLELIAGFLR